MNKPSKKVIYEFLDFILRQKEENSPVSYIAIKNALNIFSIPFGFTVIPAETPLFRIRVHEEEEADIVYERIHDIAHRNDLNRITRFGRANEPLQSIFYCSTVKETAFFETSQTVRLLTNAPFEVSTIGIWRLQKDITVANLPLNIFNKGKNEIAEILNQSFCELIEQYKNEDTDDFKKVLELFSIEFSKKSEGNDNDYLISCAFANYIYDNSGINFETKEQVKVQGIMYPSVQWSKDGMNLALKPKVIEDEILKLEVAIRQNMKREGDKEYRDTDTLIAKSIDYKDYRINWK